MININQRLLLAVVTVSLFFFSVISFAETKIFVKEYTYMASDIDSKVSSRAIALEQVKRALLEQLGTYLISETEVKNYQMTKDQITTLTAGIVSAEAIDEKWDGRTYYLKAKISADPMEVAKSVDILRSDKQRSKELEESKAKAEEAMKAVVLLKKELESVKANSKKQDDYNLAIRILSASDWFDKGLALKSAGDFQNAIEAFNISIKLHPQDSRTYFSRGIAYGMSENTQQAIDDFNRAIDLNPQMPSAYLVRGFAYAKLGNLQQAIKDYNKTIELNPQYADAYHHRGLAYDKLGNKKQAIKDYNKAIELKKQSN